MPFVALSIARVNLDRVIWRTRQRPDHFFHRFRQLGFYIFRASSRL
jgi:hypothetical protein